MTVSEVFSSSRASLGLPPSSPDQDIQHEQMLDICQRLALCGDAIDSQQHQYFVGDRFLELVSFMGCSPQVQLDDEGNKDFTRIVLHVQPRAALFHGEYTRPPQCPACNKPVGDWREQPWRESGRIECSNCGKTSSIANCNWRRGACVATSVIEITDIYPREVLPQPALLAKLGDLTGCEWQHFYF